MQNIVLALVHDYMWYRHDEMIFAPRALRAGAHGYINKRESVETLIGAVRQVLRGELYFSSRLASRLLRRSGSSQDPC